MTLQTRKLNLIHNVLTITDTKVLARMERILKEERTKAYEKNMRPMSVKEFADMIERSHTDVLAGCVVELTELRKEAVSW